MLNALLNNINAYIYVKDCSGHYVYVNQKVADLFGLSAADIVGKEDSEFFDLNHIYHNFRSFTVSITLKYRSDPSPNVLSHILIVIQ